MSIDEQAVIFQAVTFGSGAIEVAYAEGRDMNGPVAEYRTIVIPAELVIDELNEVFDSLGALLDRALTIKRNPPERVRR